MLKLQISDGNNNSDFIKRLVEVICKEIKQMYMGIGDLEIIPKFSGDYPGSGPNEALEIALKFGEKIEREKVAYLTMSDFLKVMEDTRTIRKGVFVCFSESSIFDYNFRPKVEVKTIDKIQHELGIIEIRILDGDLFFVLSNEDLIIKKIKEAFANLVVS